MTTGVTKHNSKYNDFFWKRLSKHLFLPLVQQNDSFALHLHHLHSFFSRFYWFTWMISIYANRKLSPPVSESQYTFFGQLIGIFITDSKTLDIVAKFPWLKTLKVQQVIREMLMLAC